MKTLYILRHAKSSWSYPELADYDRPLNDRGLSSAPFMGDLIAGKGYEPSIVLCSPAERAKVTAELVKEHAGIGAEIQFDARIYEASPNSLKQVVSEIDDSVDSAMLVGHNPGIEGFIRYLTNETEAMPTAALAVINTEIDTWAAISAGCGTLTTIYRPKDEAAKQDL